MVAFPFTISACLLACVAILLPCICRRLRPKSLKDLQGPSATSWFVGHLPDIIRTRDVGEADFSWMHDFGNSFRMKGAFGADVLFTADPKALQYILNTSAYNYPKPPEARLIIDLRAGKGIAWCEGEQHVKQKRILTPAFSYNSLKSFLPLFQHTAQRTIIKWRDLIANKGESYAVLDVFEWFSRTALDSLGAAAFDYDFGAINEENDNELSAAYHYLSVGTFLEQTDRNIALGALPAFLPGWVISVMQSIPNKRSTIFQNYMRVALSVAKSLVDRQLKSHAGEGGGKDIISILVKANKAESPKDKLTEHELLSQLTTLMIAGHESVAATLTWSVYELSKHTELQAELREEIGKTRAESERRGNTELTIADLDSMRLLGAVIKETLRFHPIVGKLEREAAHDDVIPLSSPVITKTGKVLHAIHISKGQRVLLGFAGYNRLKSIWGEDADSWKPKRFMESGEKRQDFNIGTLANLATFSSGVRGCIGWRFAMLELQVLLMEFVENFEFFPPPGNIEIQRVQTNMMTPMIKGSTTGNIELPLIVKAIL